ncbi:hypothetical protein [Paenibacillus glycanilyticus]|uniref:Uncharacterized protein n=1 Tax=Paenibacillus glycanilyticus TaxID=126569 RepID=A0ABQ6GAB2_9BACL|nr:hypothetical protein [Paenibacillus glycanilyticus]GLX67425.1 hypothetical protein MU1_17700 [Paenibacillus glycanilyticus]
MPIKSKKSLIVLMITGAVVWLLGAIASGIYFFKVIDNPARYYEIAYTDPSPVPLFVFGFISSLGFILAVVTGIIYLTVYITSSQRVNSGK